MLNPIPELLTLSFFAPFLLRIAVGLIFLSLGYRHIVKERAATAAAVNERWGQLGTFFVWYLGIAEIAAGLLILLGLWTQIAAIVGAVIAIKMLFLKKRHAVLARESTLFYGLLLAVCLSLLVSGAGAFAFDLPL